MKISQTDRENIVKNAAVKKGTNVCKMPGDVI